ncbi:hypothetical protein OnM2_078043 [Erysiphe neolycopersici]|uniref:Uncharacterized protein n=1 Tax=Erysiphe neolycopersici TaxID=212602 RepID=A0A420HH67_9PEZI|nr:hypothetical protein OnM2_078043 [Erysiphe neolycopersici]
MYIVDIVENKPRSERISRPSNRHENISLETSQELANKDNIENNNEANSTSDEISLQESIIIVRIFNMTKKHEQLQSLKS